MIKIHYKGYDVEVSSVDELKQLIGKSEVVVGGGERKQYRKSHTRAPWNHDEMQRIFQYLKEDKRIAEISRDSLLRARHSKGAIYTMAVKARHGKHLDGFVSKKVAGLITEFHSNLEGTRIPMRTW